MEKEEVNYWIFWIIGLFGCGLIGYIIASVFL